jgi:hypothetical protein
MTRQIPLVKERLRELSRPASISEIGEGLEIPERTLRRWLSRLVDTGFARAYGQKKGRRYVISDAAGQQPGMSTEIHVGNLHQRAWSADTADHISPVGNQPQLQSYEANNTNYLSASQHQRLQGHAALVNFGLTLDDHGIIDAAYHSGRLDGNQCSHGETERLWYEGLNDSASLDRDQVRSLNQLESCRSLFALKSQTLASQDLISGERLRGINYLLSDGLIDSQYQGAYRRLPGEANNGHDGQDSNVAQQLRSLLNVAQKIRNPFEQSLFLLAYITRIAPFHSANAATARAAANLPLIRQQLPPIIFSTCQRDDYETAFSLLLEKNDVSRLAQLYVQTYEQDCQHFRAGQQSACADTVRIRYRQQRRHLIRDITSKPGAIDSFKHYISNWASHHIPETQRHAFIQETINDLARLAPFNLAAFGITDEQWQQWRQYCVERGIRFKTQKMA